MKLPISYNLDRNAASNSGSDVRREAGVRRPTTAHVPGAPSVALAMFRYWAAIRRHAWRIALFIAVTVLATGFILFRIPKKYQGTATVRVDPSVQIDVVSNQPGNLSQSDLGPQLATDMQEIVSPSVVTPAVLKLGLKSAVDDGSPAGVSAVVTKVTQGIKVSRVTGTYLLNISYRSTSPDQAAAVANELAEQFIEHEYETRSGALLSLSQYMRQQVQQLGDRMKDSQLALEAFERDNDIVNPEAMSSSLNQQLSSLQQELDQEQSQQRILDSNLALAKEGDLDALIVSDRGSALVPLLQARQQAEIDFASLASQYGPGNYLYQQGQRKLTHIDDAIRTEEEHVAAQIGAQTKAAAMQVELTEKRLADVKAQLSDFNQKNVQFAILKQKSDTDKALYNDLLERLDSADITAGYHSTALRIVNPARPDPVPVYPRIGLTLLFVFLLSGTLGIVGAVTASSLDRSLSDPGTIGETLGVELFGFLPEVEDDAELKSLVTSEDALGPGNRTPFVEAVLGIRSTLLLRQSVVPLRSLAVISCQPQEGKTTVAANLAATFAALGKRTVLLDGDLLRPRIHRVMNVSNRTGLSSLLLEQAQLEEVLRPGPIERLTVLPAGPTSARARELLASGIERWIEELESQFDMVVVDTLPLLGFADTLNIAAAVDEPVLVIRAGKTPQEYVQVAMQQLRQVQAPVSGIVLNGVQSQSSPYYHWYGYDHYRQYASVNGNHDKSV